MALEGKNVPKWTTRKPILYLGAIVFSLWVIVIIFTYRGQLRIANPAKYATIHNTSPEPACKAKQSPTPTPHPSHNASSLSITLHGPAVHGVIALLTDSQGRTTGIKPDKTEETIVEQNDIPNSGTFGVAIADPQSHEPASNSDRNILINNPLNGDYKLDISGSVANTPYDLYISAISPDGLRVTGTGLHGKTRIGTVSRYSISYWANLGSVLTLDVTENPATASAKLSE